MENHKRNIGDLATLRQKAENLLENKILKTASQRSEMEMQKIFHELQVNQIELEMQNEELIAAKVQAEVATQKYIELYDLAPSGYFTLSEEGAVIESNLSGSKMLGIAYQDNKNCQFDLFVSNETKPIFNVFLRKIFYKNSLETCEVTLVGNDHLPMYVYLTGHITQNGKQCLLNAVDISELRQAGEALRESERRNRSIILQTAMDGFMLVDRQGHLTDVNETYCRMSGYSMQELLAMNLSNLEVVEDAEDTSAHMAKLIVKGEDRFETRHRRKDGSVFDVEISAQYQHVESGRFVAFLHDITERKEAERYREMTREILQILNEPGDIQELIDRALTVLKTGSGFEAVGIRLEEGDDFPYVSQKGFAREFLLTENTLIDRSRDGSICRDKNGKACLECACGLVISGKNDQSKPFFTPGGSWWTNDSYPLLNIAPDEDARFHPRNKCIQHGYASIALVPIRNKERIVGLIQMNDFRKDRFTRNIIEKLEGIASHIGAAIMRKHAEQTLNESEKRVRLKLQSILSPEGSISDLELNDIIDAPSIQKLMDNFYELTQIPMAIIDVKGKILVGVGWQDICTKFHRVHPESCMNCVESDIHLTQGIPEGDFRLYRCKNNMWDIATPVYIGAEHKGNLFMGQFFFENDKIDYTLFCEQAVRYGFAEQEYLDALDKAPRIGKQKLENAKAFFLNLSHSISQLSYSNIKLARAITQQKIVEDALRESEEFLNKAQEISHLGSWSLDMLTNRLTWSDEIYRIFGLQSNECSASYEAFLDVIHPQDRDVVNSAYTKSILEDRNSFEIEYRIVRKHSGELRHVYEKCEHLRDGSGKILRSVGMIHDITEQKQSAEAILENERLLRESQAAAHIGSYSADLVNKTWKASPEIYEIFGIDHTYPHTLDGWVRSIHPDFRDELSTELFNIKIGKNIFEHDYKIIRFNDGEVRWVQGFGEFEYNDHSNPVRLIGTIQDITKRKQAEEALHESNEKIIESVYDLNKAESVAHLGHWKWNIKTTEVNWSDEMYRIFGIDKNSYSGRLGDVIAKVIHPEDLHLLHPSKADNFIKQKGIEYRIILPDRSIRHIAAEAGESIVDRKGNPIYLTGVAQDITERKMAEHALKKLNEELEDRVKERTDEILKSNAALQQTEEKYRTVADHTHGWEFWLDKHDHFIYCSPSCERITGYNASEFIKNPGLFFKIVHPDDLKSFLQHKQKEDLCQVGNPELQYRIVRADGSIRWIGHECQTIFDDSGNFMGIRGSNRDITGRKEIEQLLKTNNQKYKLLSENISDGIFICREGRFDYVNNAMTLIFGYDEQELNGMKLTQLVKPEYLDDFEIFHPMKIRANRIKNFESECLKRDQSTIFVEFLLNYIAKDKVIYGVIHDITEKKQIQKNIVSAIIRTEENERAYFSKELHDGLGPLLSTIKLYLQWSGRPKTHQSRQDIVHKAEEILEEALTTVKEISYKLSPHLLINYGLTSAIRSFADKVEETSAIKIAFDSNVSRRLGSDIEAAIYRAVIECINNTLKHSKAKNITIMMLDTVTQIMIHYSDNGIGFNLLETLSMNKGLGLFNLQNRIQTIGGKITLFSQPGKGVDYQIIINI